MAEQEVTAEQLIEEIRRIKVSDLLLSTVSTLARLGYAKLEPASRDLPQARLAIDSLRVLLPVLGEAVPDQTVKDFNQVVTNLQLAYASAAAGTPEPEPDPEQ